MTNVDIFRKEKVDELAKLALNQETHDDQQVIWSDLKLKVNTHLEQLWQTDWDTEVNNKLHEIRPNLKERLNYDERLNRKQETVVSRLRIGHSWITHEYLLKGEQQPYCTACGLDLEIVVVLLATVEVVVVAATAVAAAAVVVVVVVVVGGGG
ncbi:RNA-directed DNA polymerase from transposon X-element [Elysia marginata]|uniref:RNA-directed DNA polymerase from transposon X-element n=1 Tax=Elysia marginata TaxID=1093978 RepID=A0AAV4EKH7_9GAST|nr:RNA-directed DNA polymerase from transposon X-element [Elysia marginata]